MNNVKELVFESKGQIKEDDLHKALCKDVIKEFGIDLASIWYFNNRLTSLTCKYCLDKNKKINLTNLSLQRKDYPNYFNNILENVFMSANDIYKSPYTSELINDHYKPNNIQTTLDYIIYNNGNPLAIISCQSVSKNKEWNTKDTDYLRVLTVMASLELRKYKKT